MSLSEIDFGERKINNLEKCSGSQVIDSSFGNSFLRHARVLSRVAILTAATRRAESRLVRVPIPCTGVRLRHFGFCIDLAVTAPLCTELDGFVDALRQSDRL